MDVLADMLARARARGALFSALALARPWGVEFGGGRPLTLHCLLGGEAWLESAGAAPIHVGPGDLVLGRAGTAYRLVHAPGAPAIPISEARRRGDADPGTGGARLLCGAYTLEGGVCDGLLESLPRFVILPASVHGPDLRAVIALLATEIGGTAQGRQTVLDRLLDLVLVFTLRTWFADRENPSPGWYHALEDPSIGPVLRAIHAAPAEAWTLERMAAIAGLSRAAFARRFTTRVGQPAAGYLTDLRMDLAETELLAPGTTIGTAAAAVGYASEFAFAAAFKRQRGVPPGVWRREHLRVRQTSGPQLPGPSASEGPGPAIISL